MKDEKKRKVFIKLANKNELILISNKCTEDLNIETHPGLFELYITELLINAVKHSNFPNVNIFIEINEREVNIKNSYGYDQKYLDKRINNTQRLGLKILKTIEHAFNLYSTPLKVDNGAKHVCKTLKIIT